MKRKIFSVLFALVLVFSFSLVMAAPVSAATAAVWHVPEDFATIQDAIDSDDVLNGDTIVVGAGNWFGAVVNKAVEIRGEDGAVIDDGPSHGSWTCGFKLIAGSDGATISHFTFEGLGLPIYGLGVDDVTVEHNKIYDTMQGITNWDGDSWVIRLNVIEGIAVLYNSGGIGICVGSRFSEVSGNVVAHNTIVADIPDDHAFSVGGILLCADARSEYGFDPDVVSNNKIVHNRVKITGPLSWAIALQVIWRQYPPEDPVGYAQSKLFDNIVGFNDLRGSDTCIGYFPSAAILEPVNKVSRNLGEDANRGQGEVPANVFNPVN